MTEGPSISWRTGATKRMQMVQEMARVVQKKKNVLFISILLVFCQYLPLVKPTEARWIHRLEECSYLR
jgi:hypothetical protein